jgi:hypothetical protein
MFVHMQAGGFRYYLKQKHSRLEYLGALWREPLDGTGVGEELDGWGPSEQNFQSVLAAFAGNEGMVESPAGSSEASGMSEGEEDVLWEMEALQLGGNSSAYDSESDSGESTLILQQRGSVPPDTMYTHW